MTYYYLFGSEAVSAFEERENTGDKFHTSDGSTFAYNEETMSPNCLLEMADGWGAWLPLTEDEYYSIEII